jgi:hypothetical protein
MARTFAWRFSLVATGATRNVARVKTGSRKIRNRETRRLTMSAAPVSRFAAIRRSSSVKSLRTRISEVDMNIPLRH